MFVFKQKTAYEMRISDWSSDVCSSDLRCGLAGRDRVSADLCRAFQHGGGGRMVVVAGGDNITAAGSDIEIAAWRMDRVTLAGHKAVDLQVDAALRNAGGKGAVVEGGDVELGTAVHHQAAVAADLQRRSRTRFGP